MAHRKKASLREADGWEERRLTAGNIFPFEPSFSAACQWQIGRQT